MKHSKFLGTRSTYLAHQQVKELNENFVNTLTLPHEELQNINLKKSKKINCV